MNSSLEVKTERPGVGIIIYAAGSEPNLPEYSFYNNTVRLRFDQSCWTYFRIMPDGSLVAQSGVTGVVKIIDKSAPLMAWAVRMAMEKLKRLLVEGGYIAGDGHDSKLLFEGILDEIITVAKKADKEELEAAGETGHIAHDWIEQLINSILSGNENRRLELLAKLPTNERAANACIAAVGWMAEHNVRWTSTERKVFSLFYGYAGTMDGLARVDSCADAACCPHEFKDRLTLVDWKTSNALHIEYLLQTAAYQQAYQEETGEKIEDRWVIRLGKEDAAEFDPWHTEGNGPFQKDLEGFLNALALYRSLHKIEDRISDINEQKRAQAREILAAERAVRCLDADKYKGVRKKKGCNGTDIMCETCTDTYQKHNESSEALGTN